MKYSVCLTRVFALAVLLVGVSAAAQAQSYGGSFTLPHETRWNGAVLPAGEYTLAMDTMKGPLRVVDSSGRFRVLAYGIADEPGKAQPTALLITRDGPERAVRSLNCPAWGRKFVYKPFTRAERALIANGEQAETVPVRMASR